MKSVLAGVVAILITSGATELPAQDLSPIIGPKSRDRDTGVQAQSDALELTHAQRRRVFEQVEHSGVVGPKDYKPTIGEKIPDSIELRDLPEDVRKAMPALKTYRYAKVDLKVLIVDDERKIVEIIENPLL